MQHVEVRHRYAAPPQAVWDIYVDHARWSEWSGFPASKLVTQGSPDPNGTGAVRAFPGVQEEVIDFEPPKRMTYSVVGGFFPITNHLGEVTFEADGEGTLLVWRCRFEPKIPRTGGLLQRFITSSFRRALDGLGRRGFAPAA